MKTDSGYYSALIFFQATVGNNYSYGIICRDNDSPESLLRLPILSSKFILLKRFDINLQCWTYKIKGNEGP